MSPVPIGEVLLLIDDRRRAGGLAPIERVAARMLQRSAAPVSVWRRVDGQEDELGLGDGLGVARREAQVARGDALGDQLGQARLVQLHVAALEGLDECDAAVHAVDVVAELGQPGGHDQADVAAADDGDVGVISHRRQRPSARSSAGSVLRRIWMSSRGDQVRMYSRSWATQRSKSGSRRELICHRPVMPGFIARRA